MYFDDFEANARATKLVENFQYIDSAVASILGIPSQFSVDPKATAFFKEEIQNDPITLSKRLIEINSKSLDMIKNYYGANNETYQHLSSSVASAVIMILNVPIGEALNMQPKAGLRYQELKNTLFEAKIILVHLNNDFYFNSEETMKVDMSLNLINTIL